MLSNKKIRRGEERVLWALKLIKAKGNHKDASVFMVSSPYHLNSIPCWVMLNGLSYESWNNRAAVCRKDNDL